MEPKVKQEGDLYSIRTSDLYFEVDASFGAHVSSFKVKEHELLYFSGIEGDYLVGSTLWPSPQRVWEWPPSAELDREPYSARIVDNSIVMESKVDPVSGLMFRKIFRAAEKGEYIKINYEVINSANTETRVAAWAVTRVPSQGSLTFFPSGEGAVSGPLAAQTVLIDKIVWFQQKSTNPEGAKFFSDGSEGWLAHVSKDRFLFVKHFEDVPANVQAPEEAEIELYYKNQHELIELENQSAYFTVPAGGSFEYAVEWHAVKLPDHFEVNAGSSHLVESVKKLLSIR